MDFFIILFLIIFFLLIVVGFFAYWSRRDIESLKLVTLLVKIPRQDPDQQNDFIKEINLSEQLLISLAGIAKAMVFEVAVHNSGGEIFFYLSVPRDTIEFTTRQIQGYFPDASVLPSTDYTIFNENSAVVAGYVQVKENQVLPFRTYREAEVDTFAPVISTLSKLDEIGAGATLQVVIKPTPPIVKKSITSVIEKMKQGEKFSEAIQHTSIIKDLKQALFKKTDSQTKENIIDEEIVKALNQKLAKPLFWVNLRIVVSANSSGQASEIFSSIASSLTQFTAPLRNSFKIIKPRRTKKLIYDYIFREFRQKTAILLNAEEITSFFHLPASSTDVPRIKWLNTKEAPPPDNLPKDGVIIGTNDFRGDRQLIKILDNDRRRHFYIIGQTGTGKSYLMLNLAKQDMEAGRGLCVIDPHGELVDKVLSVVPENRVDDCIIFNPGDISRPLGLNMLEFNPNRPEDKTFIVGEMQSIFNRLFDKETMGPMFEQYMRNALLLLMEDAKYEPATLMEVPRVFTDSDWRQKKLARITNPTVIDFWHKEASKTTGEHGLSNITPYITSKFGNFITNDYMRPIIGQTKSAFNFRQVMDERKILLVNLAKGKIGDINAGLLGMIVTGRLLLAALSRADIDENQRQDFYLYIDEFQNFTTDSIAVILAEARKYRLNLILAHQFVAQLTDPIRESVFGNVGSLASFRVGPTDAEFLNKHFSPPFSEKSLISIENQNAFLKLLINGEPARPFNIKTIDTPEGSIELRNKLKELSRLTYGRDLREVEQNIISRLKT